MNNNTKDYTGQKFNNLTAIEKLPNYNNSGRTYYLCKCDCGNERIVYSYYLTLGKVKACKECVKENNPRRKNYVGSRFGRLTIEKMLYNYNNTNSTYARCKCDCGNYKNIAMQNILNGHTQSCGCLEKESRFNRKHEKDISGERFGKLLVLEKTDKKGENSSIIWKCLCDCGNITYSNGTSLKNGHKTSCGCNKKEYIDSLKINVNKGDRYGYLTILKEVNSQGNRRFKCLCDCGNITEVPLSDLRSNHTQSCGCMKFSKGEQYIESLLKEWNIKYTTQKRFENCKNIYQLPFDFYLDEYNACIEYQGEQHYRSVKFWGGNDGLEYRQNNDYIKKEFCNNNNINLICLPYTLSNEEIKQILIDFLEPVTTTVA